MSHPLVDAARALVARVRDADPAESVALLKSSGVLAAHVPARLGGPELALSETAEITRLLGTADGSLAQIPQSHFTFTRWLFAGEHPELEEHWAQQLLGGALVANAQAEFEPVLLESGHISGTKKWCTGSTWADVIAVTARHPGEEEQSLCVFLPVDTPGIRIIDDWNGLGQQHTGSGTVLLEGVEAPLVYRRDHALGLPGYGAFAQLLHAAIDVGVMQAAVGETVTRLRGGDGDRLLHHQVGELTQQTWVAQASLRQAAAEVDALRAGAADPHETALSVAAAKTWVAQAAVDVSSRIFEVLGASQATADSGMDIYWRDLRTHTLHDRRREKLEILGRTALTGELPELGTKL